MSNPHTFEKSTIKSAMQCMICGKLERDLDHQILQTVNLSYPYKQNIETDPLGKDAHSPGAKLDVGKNRLQLVLGSFPRALYEVGLVGTYGANKYTDNGWMSVPKGVERYSDALLRHWLAHCRHKFDQESGLLHISHMAWNALAILELSLRDLEDDLETGRTGQPE